jgi:choline dehydrogenase-like flavoprotein
MVARVKGVETLNTTTKGLKLAREIARWCAGRPSALAVSPSIAYLFWKTRPELDLPDVQMMFTPGSYLGGIPGLLDSFPGLTLGFYQQRPESRGYVRAKSARATDDPAELPFRREGPPGRHRRHEARAPDLRDATTGALHRDGDLSRAGSGHGSGPARLRATRRVAFLASGEAQAITGVNLPVDCGWLVGPSWHTYGGLRPARTV